MGGLLCRTGKRDCQLGLEQALVVNLCKPLAGMRCVNFLTGRLINFWCRYIRSSQVKADYLVSVITKRRPGAGGFDTNARLIGACRQ